MTPKNFGFGSSTGTAMDPNNPPQVAPEVPQVAPEVPQQSPLDQIQGYYQNELGRAGDEGGLDYWTGQAKSGMSMEDIRNAINNSQEGQRYDINDLYRTELGREADTGGFDYWLSQLQGGMSLDDIRNQGFRASDEYKNRQPEPTFDPYNPPQVYDPYNTPEVQPKGFGPTGDVVPPQYPFPDLGKPAPEMESSAPSYPTSIPYDPTQMDDFSNPGKNTGNVRDLFGAGGLFGLGMNKGILPQEQIDSMDGVNNPFQWVTSQPQSVQNRFNEYLSIFKDPKKAFIYTVTGGPGAPYRD